MMPNSHFLSSICSIPSWRVFQNLTPCWLSSDSDSDKTGGGVSRFLLALGKFSAGKGERRVCVVYSRWLRTILLQSWDGLVPAAFRRILLTRPWCLFRARPAFVLVCEDHLCHETGVLYEALVSMFTFVARREFSMRHLCPC